MKKVFPTVSYTTTHEKKPLLLSRGGSRQADGEVTLILKSELKKGRKIILPFDIQ